MCLDVHAEWAQYGCKMLIKDGRIKYAVRPEPAEGYSDVFWCCDYAFALECEQEYNRPTHELVTHGNFHYFGWSDKNILQYRQHLKDIALAIRKKRLSAKEIEKLNGHSSTV